jgi:hypothetical protein
MNEHPFSNLPVIACRFTPQGGTLREVALLTPDGEEFIIPAVVAVAYEREVQGFPMVTITMLATYRESYDAPAPEPSH